MATAIAAPVTRVRRRLPRVPRALAPPAPRGPADRRTQEAQQSLKSSPARSRKNETMTVYCDEPKTAAELLARYRDVKRRLYPVPTRPPTRELAPVDTENIVAFALAVAAVTVDRTREANKRAKEAPLAVGLESPGSLGSQARAALQAVSQRTGVPVEAILGRQRFSAIAAARHEAIWRVREVTKWSLPRVGRFFAGRDHTTVLHSVRRMEDRAARDPELRAYMAGIKQACPMRRPSVAR